MKNVFSKVLLASGLVMGLSAGSSMAQTATVPDVKRGETLYMAGDMERGILACVACHGVGGNSPLAMYPHVAGLPEGYTIAQLKNFQVPEGATKAARTNPDGTPTLMAPTVLKMNDQDMRDLAAYIAGLELTNPAFAKNAGDVDFVQRGRQIYRAGIPERNVPACASCHGAEGKGMPELYPFLSGQYPEYIEQQLQAFANGHRQHGGVDNQMGSISDRMTNADIKAVADYAAGIR